MNNINTAIDLIKNEYQDKYHIKGGYGISSDDAIVFDVTVWRNFIELEYEIVNFIANHINKSLKVRKQHLTGIDSRCFDILSIEEESTNIDKCKFDLFFDINECWNKKSRNKFIRY